MTIEEIIQYFGPFASTAISTIGLYLHFNAKLEAQANRYEGKLRATNEYYRTEIKDLQNKYEEVNKELGVREGANTIYNKIDSKLDVLINQIK